MIKKNQFALIFLTIVTMLAVWYIKSPVASDKNDNPDNTTPVITDEEERNLKGDPLEARNKVLAQLQANVD